MRRAAATAAILLVVGTVVLAGEEGVELVYEFGAGEAPAAAKVLTRRFELLGVDGARVEALEGGKRVAIRLDARDRLEEVRAIAARIGRLEMRRVVDPEAPGYAKRRKELADALARGTEPEKACEIPPESLTREERGHLPCGLRWYRNPHPSETLKDDWVLCEVDAEAITEDALDEVRVLSPDGTGAGGWSVWFSVKEPFRATMADLTRFSDGEDTRLAVIVDGEVLSAPVLKSPLSRNGQVTMHDEQDARALAVAFGGGLPRKPELVEERAIGR